MKDLNKQRRRLSDIELELEAEQLDIPLRKGRVTYLRRKVPESKGTYRNLDVYAIELRDIDGQLEKENKKQMEQKSREEEEAKGRIKLREWDF
ncbi:MAG: hypothetical protein ACKVJG_24505 [Candidatus Latescibacterota bacterium]|jgi:hypothetical protein